MDSAKLNYIHLCDAASVDSNGKLSILGIFGRIFLQNIPSKFPKFTVVFSLTFKKLNSEKQKIEVKIFDPKSKELKTKQPIQLELNIDKEKFERNTEVNLILDVANFEFLSYGSHSLAVYLENQKIGDTSLQVEERSEN